MEIIISISRIILPVITAVLLVKCMMTLFLGNPKETIYGYITDMQTGERYPLNMWETSIGKSAACDISINSNGFSRVDAVITRRIDGWYIYDTATRTGISGGKKSETKHTMQHGDIITIGGRKFRFEVADDPVIKIGKQKKKPPKGEVKGTGNTASSTTTPTTGVVKSTKPTKKVTQYCLVNKKTNETFVLCGNVVKIGRGFSSHLRLQNPAVSRVHAVVALYEDGWAIENVGAGETYLNGKKVTEPQLLFYGDVILIADEKLYFEVRTVTEK